ncbi:MAG TPA: hypothetical protein VH914_00560 [Acidimicrobiia bacterium]|nr:hypothetical protein [Acidimicrobiia bacterium]
MGRVVVWIATACVVAFFAVGGLYVWHGNAPYSPPAAAKAAPKNGLVKAAARAAIAAAPGAMRIMLVGNSVAHSLAPAIGAQPGVAVFDASWIGCQFPPQIPTAIAAPNGGLEVAPPCDPPGEADAVTRFSPNVAVWIPADFYGAGGHYEGVEVKPCSPGFDSLYRSDLVAEVRQLGSTGARVVLANQPYSRAAYFPRHDRAIDCENRVVADVAHAMGAQLLDLLDYVCPKSACRSELRSDGIHYAGRSAKIVARWISEQVTR